MVKKILTVLGISGLLFLPFVVSAQVPPTPPSNCCMLRHVIAPYGVGDCVAEPAATACLSKGTDITAACGGVAALNLDPDWGGYCTMDTVYTVTDWIFWIFLAFVVIMGVMTGFMFMTAGGDPAKIEKARGMIVYLVVGIIVAVIVKVIPALTRSIVGL